MSKNPQLVQQHIFRDHYQALLGNASWMRIHPAIRRRFSGDQSAIYKGKMREVRLSFLGFILAQLCRLIGSPLAFYRGRDVPVTVEVRYDRVLDGFSWDRSYFFPQGLSRVSSTKCVVGKLGLVEVLSHGFGMQLKVSEEASALVFRSCAYFWQMGGVRFRLPALISPGETLVRQVALDDNRFRFELELRHPICGLLARQDGVFSAANSR